jgi:dTDP-4-dehydrorhamnose 3,5-epimerase
MSSFPIDGMDIFFPDWGHVDERGLVYTTSFNFDKEFVEEKVSISQTNVMRGFHGDPHTGKLFTCFSGKLKMVVVDRRKGSKTFFRGGTRGLFSTILSADRNTHLYVPPGCLNAHYVIEGPATLHYKTTSKYKGIAFQKTVRWDDTIIDGFPEVTDPIVSERDAQGISLEEIIL